MQYNLGKCLLCDRVLDENQVFVAGRDGYYCDVICFTEYLHRMEHARHLIAEAILQKPSIKP